MTNPGIAAVAIALASMAWPGASALADEPFTLPPAVLKVVEPLVAAYAPAKRHAVWVVTDENHNPGNFGRPMYFDGSTRFTLQPRGLWQVESSVEHRGKQSSGSAVALSLCGLVPLLTASSGSFRPWQGLGLLGEVEIPDAFTSRARVVEFSASTADVCRPVTGLSFELDLVRESHRRLGLLPTTSKRRERFACKVGETVPATSLGLALEAKALKVACERRYDDDPAVNVDYAFVEPIAAYLVVRTFEHRVTGEFKSIYTYQTFEFPAN